MSRAGRKQAAFAADRLLARLGAAKRARCTVSSTKAEPALVAALIADDLIARDGDGGMVITAAGRARLARLAAASSGGDIGVFRSQHLAIAPCRERPDGAPAVAGGVVNEAESPLAWLARRKGRDGQAMITTAQFQAGDRLRTDYTLAQLTPRMSVDWASPSAGTSGSGAGGPAALADTAIAAKQRLRRALDAAGPEFAGLLLDVCCFLKGLEDVERERRWPARSGKIVLQLGLDRLARHYGLGGEARGRGRAPLRTWLAADAHFTVTEEAGPSG